MAENRGNKNRHQRARQCLRGQFPGLPPPAHGQGLAPARASRLPSLLWGTCLGPPALATCPSLAPRQDRVGSCGRGCRAWGAGPGLLSPQHPGRRARAWVSCSSGHRVVRPWVSRAGARPGPPWAPVVQLGHEARPRPVVFALEGADHCPAPRPPAAAQLLPSLSRPGAAATEPLADPAGREQGPGTLCRKSTGTWGQSHRGTPYHVGTVLGGGGGVICREARPPAAPCWPPPHSASPPRFHQLQSPHPRAGVALISRLKWRSLCRDPDAPHCRGPHIH